MRILICGSRTYNRPVLADGTLGNEGDDPLLDAVMTGFYEDWVHDVTFIFGDARGADKSAHITAKASEYPFDGPYKADWDTYNKRAGFLRNRRMLDEGQPDIVVAFVDKPLAQSKGTDMMVNLARGAGIPTYVVEKVS